jgi:hypothetical protein
MGGDPVLVRFAQFFYRDGFILGAQAFLIDLAEEAPVFYRVLRVRIRWFRRW